MKSVGKQLEEARLAKNWTPELAARETKIKVDRLHDLEVDDYSNFSSPTYARGFVRTYARALGLDEYRILRQLDNKLPEDDNASFANETGLPYVPEPSQTIHASSANRTGLYVVMGLGFAVMLVISAVLFDAYRAGELPRYFANSSDNSTVPSTNAAPMVDADAPAHALPVDPNDTTHSVRAVPVDLNQLSADTNAAPAATNAAPLTGVPAAAAVTPPVSTASTDTATAIPVNAPRALPVDPASLTNTAPIAANAVPASGPPPAAPTSVVPPPTPARTPSLSARGSNETTADSRPPPRALPVDPSELNSAAAADATAPASTVSTAAPAEGTQVAATTPVDLSPTAPSADATSVPDKRLILTASRDSFVRVTSLDKNQGDKDVLYDSVLRAGQSLAFGGHKFSVNVGIPSAVDIALDGVNYGPHSDRDSPETFTLESHQP